MFKYTYSLTDFSTTVELDLNNIDNSSLFVNDGESFKPIANFHEIENIQFPDQSYVIISDFNRFNTVDNLYIINKIMEICYPDIEEIKLETK